MSKKIIIKSATFYYKSDEDTGYNVELNNKLDETVGNEAVTALVERCQVIIDQVDPSAMDDVLDGIQQHASDTGEFLEAGLEVDELSSCCDVVFLLHYDRIPSDEFNGILISCYYEVEEDVIFLQDSFPEHQLNKRDKDQTVH